LLIGLKITSYCATPTLNRQFIRLLGKRSLHLISPRTIDQYHHLELATRFAIEQGLQSFEVFVLDICHVIVTLLQVQTGNCSSLGWYYSWHKIWKCSIRLFLDQLGRDTLENISRINLLQHLQTFELLLSKTIL